MGTRNDVRNRLYAHVYKVLRAYMPPPYTTTAVVPDDFHSSPRTRARTHTHTYVHTHTHTHAYITHHVIIITIIVIILCTRRNSAGDKSGGGGGGDVLFSPSSVHCSRLRLRRGRGERFF